MQERFLGLLWDRLATIITGILTKLSQMYSCGSFNHFCVHSPFDVLLFINDLTIFIHLPTFNKTSSDVLWKSAGDLAKNQKTNWLTADCQWGGKKCFILFLFFSVGKRRKLWHRFRTSNIKKPDLILLSVEQVNSWKFYVDMGLFFLLFLNEYIFRIRSSIRLPWCYCVVAKWMAALEKKLREAKQKSELINVLFALCEEVAMGSRGMKRFGGGRGCKVSCTS